MPCSFCLADGGLEKGTGGDEEGDGGGEFSREIRDLRISNLCFWVNFLPIF